ncbi:MAG TPA: peptidoglycan-binding protein [Pyrinomonadaceae bacterium]|nr:peptidoglycan-binding protein [Pyrinomonadaceae bacterium]
MPVLREGSKGPQVVSLKKKLKALRFDPGPLDEDFSAVTRAAVVAFQKVKGLTQDGIAGPRTLSALPKNDLDLPLHLFEVLEEEHIALYGELKEETVVRLRGRDLEAREVTSALDWRFYQGHIRNWEEFKRHLISGPKLPESLTRLLVKEDIAKWSKETEALAFLNRLLGEYFYDREDFRHFEFTKATEKIFELYPAKDKLDKISFEELQQLNRLLLEELFPDHLESAREVRLTAIYQNRHEKPSAALCLSGGGIRSGTFALGLMQGLARHDLLKQFDYLSTVSGGGYIGGWLSAWIHRHSLPDRGLPGVTSDLTNASPRKKIDPDPAALRHLREYSNFLTPKAGLMSADTWTFVAIYVRNLLLNWSVIVPLLLAFLLIPRFHVAAILVNPPEPVVDDVKLFVPPQIGNYLSSIPYADVFNLRHLLLLAGFAAAAWAIAYIGFSRPGLRNTLIEKNPSWKERMGQRGFVKYCLVPLAIAAFLLTTYWAWKNNDSEKTWWHFALCGALMSLVGMFWSSFILRDWRGSGLWIPRLLLTLAGFTGGLFAWVATKVGGSVTVVDVDQSWATEFYVVYAVPLFLLMFMLAVIVFAGISSHFLTNVTDEDREWWARFSAWMLISALAWILLSALVIFGPLGLLQFPRLVAAVGGISGLVAIVLGRSAKTPATAEKMAQGDWKSHLSSFLLPLLAILFLAVVVASLSLLTSTVTRPIVTALTKPGHELQFSRRELGSEFAPNTHQVSQPVPLPVEFSNTKIGDLLPVGKTEPATPRQITDADVQHMRAIHYPRWWFFLALITVLFVVGIMLSRVINLNLFSLHNSYRNRLIRGFLAASRDRRRRRPNPFTGFDAADNVSMHELRPALLHEVDFIDLEGFANQLKMGGEALAKSAENNPATSQSPEGDPPQTASQFLYTQLSDKGKEAVDSYHEPTPLSPNHRVDLMEDMNRILEADEIKLWTEPGFYTPLELAAPDQPDAPPLSQRREYHIHRNRRALEQHYPQFIVPSNYPPHRLLHVVNTTLNLVGGDNLAWQQRKAESFTVSPLHCGSYRVGFRRSKDYGGDDGISLGTAMAISGAAASSNMGYYTTSPVLALALTLFNVRLGWWLGNPGPAGSHPYKGVKTDDRPGESSKKIYRRMSPTLSILPVFYEAFGLTDDQNEYVYLTDGGHFENLGLYEMVLRRCKLIVVSDGAADADYEFNDLANAVRKVRIDLGIHIEFPDVPIYSKAPGKEGEGGSYWTIGLIRYSNIDRRADGRKAEDGILIYIKPAVYEDEPEDVIHYKRTHPAFPNETTADQFFDEPQFESYRALGSYIMDRMCGSHAGDLDLVQFVTQVNQNFLRMAPQVQNKYREFWATKTNVTPTEPAPVTSGSSNA